MLKLFFKLLNFAFELEFSSIPNLFIVEINSSACDNSVNLISFNKIVNSLTLALISDCISFSTILSKSSLISSLLLLNSSSETISSFWVLFIHTLDKINSSPLIFHVITLLLVKSSFKFTFTLNHKALKLSSSVFKSASSFIFIQLSNISI